VSESNVAARSTVPRPWWRSAAIYQVYIRSFADGNGDGIGDLAGVRAKLQYLQELGVDAVWFTPWYPSPMADGGYDVADYRDIDPMFGTLGEAEQLIAEAHDLGIRVIIDIVPNHCSDRHAWFRAALAAGPGSAERERFWFRPGRGAGGGLPDFDPAQAPDPHPYVDRDELHEVYRAWRAIAESYADDRILIGEIWLPDSERFARYLRPGELHTAFNFEFLSCPWDAERL